ncbi:MAG TPA: phenylalanine--tRNA ligase subunit beta [Tepidisphaeraceae bacterium]|nr:phenylalanine--tRNA ligase subunit beta [Tepidisphaeraceae bacterium]
MKISLEWLSEYLPGATDPQAAADALTNGGLPVEVIERHGNDTVIEVEVTSNRGDCLSHIGIARELSALQNRELRDVKAGAKESSAAATNATAVRIDAPDLCPHYTARIIRNVAIKPSPAWLARRLEAIGLRPINNVVDVTNYVMFELGQPLHAFDFDRLEGRRIVVRRAARDEKLVSIDGRERTLAAEMLVIADAVRPVALPGVMGGVDSEVSNNTKNILLESARFDPLSIRKTARALTMKSDSSYRFERGIDPLLPDKASLRAAQLILETAGGELLTGAAVAGSTGYTPKKLTLRLDRLNRLLGVTFPTGQVMDAVRRLQLAPVLQADRIEVTVPSHRLDLNIEADLIEEAARIIGYDKVPVRDEIAIRLTPPDPAADVLDTIRSVSISGGYFESVTFGWVSDLLAPDFTPPEAIGLPRVDPMVRKADASLRPSLLPGLLESVGRNENVGTPDARLFEIGSTFWIAQGGKVDERRRVALVGGSDLRSVRGIVELLLNRLDPNREVRIAPDIRPGFAKAAAGRIEWGGQIVGYLGKIDRAVVDKLGLRQIPAAAELELLPLVEAAQRVPQQKPLPMFPAVRRDLSLVVPESMRYEQIETLIRSMKPELMEDLEYVTTYRGKPLEKGQKSVTVTLIFRSPSGTLTGEQVDATVQKVIDAARTQLGATLRA